MKPTINLMSRAAAVVAFIAALAVPGLNQENPSGQAGGGRRAVGASERRARDLYERTFNLRMLERQLREPARKEEPQLAFAQIGEDFMRIQVVNSGLAQATSRGGALDLKFVAKSAGEIKKRASRLKYNLVLPEPEKDTKRLKAEVGAEPEQLKSALSTLDELIFRFVRNPLFQRPDVVDAQLAATARGDLGAIIEMSNDIKKRSEKLIKAAR